MKPRAPLHAIFVHFTIALTSAAFGFDLIDYLFRWPSLRDTGWWLISTSTAITVFTVASGVVSRMRQPVAEGEARRYLRTHMALGPILFGGLLMLSIWRSFFWENASGPSLMYVIGFVPVLAVMIIQGYLGGELVYKFGLEVMGRYRLLASARDGSERP